MRRNLRFWGRFWGGSLGTIFLTLIFLACFFLLGENSSAILSAWIPNLQMLLILSASCTIYLVSIGANASYIPLLLSFGQTRKAVYTAFTLTRLVLCVVILFINSLLSTLSNSSSAMFCLTSMVPVYLILFSIGSIGGTLFVRIRWLGMAFLMAFSLGFGGSIGYVLSSTSKTLSSPLSILMAAPPWWLSLMAVAVVAADLVSHWYLLRRWEVRL